jgi:hypothetical protein
MPGPIHEIKGQSQAKSSTPFFFEIKETKHSSWSFPTHTVVDRYAMNPDKTPSQRADQDDPQQYDTLSGQSIDMQKLLRWGLANATKGEDTTGPGMTASEPIVSIGPVSLSLGEDA